jgi:serine/threonine protein kinase
VRGSQWPVRLGSGAHKVVWKGWDSADGKEVAWNEVPFTTLPAFELERLHTEVDILKSIRHPNLIAIEDTWSTEDAVVFITPFCPSGDLREYVSGPCCKTFGSECKSFASSGLSGPIPP